MTTQENVARVYFKGQGTNPLLSAGEVGDAATNIRNVLHFLGSALAANDSLCDDEGRQGLLRLLWMVEDAANVIAARLDGDPDLVRLLDQ
jgi:hypothetical protein